MTRVPITQDYITPELTPERMYYVREGDWERVKRNVKDIIPSPAYFQNAAWACLGLSSSAGFALVGFRLTKDVRTWMWVVGWLLAVAPFLLAIACFLFDWHVGEGTKQTVTGVLTEIDHIEQGQVHKMQAPSQSSGMMSLKEFLLRQQTSGATHSGVVHVHDLDSILRGSRPPNESPKNRPK